MRITAIINPGASTLQAMDREALADLLRSRFGARGHELDLRFTGGGEMDAALAAAAGSPDTDVVLAGGGDGTISAAAGRLAGTGKALAVLPGGNMNLFARSLGIPLDIEAAIEALACGQRAHADIAYANDKPFIHEFSLGLHPEMIEMRDRQKYGSRLAKLVGGLRSLSQAILRPARIGVRLEDETGNSRPIATFAIAVSNNPYGQDHLPYADRLDGGALGVYIAHARTSAELAAIAARIPTGGWAEMPQMEFFSTRRLRLNRRRSMKAAIDGEMVKMRGPVDIRIAPAALAVIVPDEAHAVRGQ